MESALLLLSTMAATTHKCLIIMDILQQQGRIKDCVVALFVGDLIGEGASRSVYELLGNDSHVLKVERTGLTFHNQTEWLIWDEAKDWVIADWFAPCVSIESWGTALVQKRTKPFETLNEFRDALQKTRGGLLPKIFSDTHYENFGMLNDRVVCHDYGYNRMIRTGIESMCEQLGFFEYDKPEEYIRSHRNHKEGQLYLDI